MDIKLRNDSVEVVSKLWQISASVVGAAVLRQTEAGVFHRQMAYALKPSIA